VCKAVPLYALKGMQFNPKCRFGTRDRYRERDRVSGSKILQPQPHHAIHSTTFLHFTLLHRCRAGPKPISLPAWLLAIKPHEAHQPAYLASTLPSETEKRTHFFTQQAIRHKKGRGQKHHSPGAESTGNNRTGTQHTCQLIYGPGDGEIGRFLSQDQRI